MKVNPNIVFFDVLNFGWWRYGKFFPYELWGDGPFIH